MTYTKHSFSERKSLLTLFFPVAMAAFSACSDSGSGDDISQVINSGVEVFSSADDLPTCAKENEGEQAFIKGETSARICVDGKWFATLDTTGNDFHCSTVKLADGTGLKVMCNGDSIGVVLNGAKGETGAQGTPGVQGDSIASCFMEEQVGKLAIHCGEKSARFIIAEDGSISVDTTILDSEKVASTLAGVYGFVQKGPFLRGSSVSAIELESGRTLTQASSPSDVQVQNDDGKFVLNTRTTVSQYVEFVGTGIYRNEITGGVSDASIALRTITDLTTRSGGVVNINLLTHLEYYRVKYLVLTEKMKFAAAKRQAEQEIFNLFLIDSEHFFNSEDLNIVGSSEGDAALLAVSVMLQGDRNVSQLNGLLGDISSDMEKDGTWDNSTEKLAIADWAADADNAGKLAIIRNNIESWKISQMVPKFEPYVRQFWYTEYGLGNCTAESVGIVKAATAGKQKDSKTRYVCKETGASSGEYRWVIANDFEKDTYSWAAGTDGEVKVGSVTGTKYYIYDATTGEWRVATVVEQVKGGCIESVAADIANNTAFVNGYWYRCENREWVRTTAYIVDTQGWVPGSDGDVQKGDNTTAYYVFDLAENRWREASANDVNLGLMGCTTNRTGEMGRSSSNNRYYSCSANHAWTLMTDKVAYNTDGIDCDVEGKMVYGKVDTKTYFVCEGGVWREATTGEEQVGSACTAALNGTFNVDSTRFCDNKQFRYSNVYDFDVGVRNYFNPQVQYGTLYDDRDNRTYKTVTINGLTVMAENLSYGDEGQNSYLINNNKCYKDNPTNCLKGGRYYTWTAAMNIDKKWLSDTPYGVDGLIQTPHQGICPNGWHIPKTSEWSALFNKVGYAAQQAKMNPEWPNATNASGFSALPVGYYDKNITNINTEIFFWSASERGNKYAETWTLKEDDAHAGYWLKTLYFAVRCFKN